MTLPRPATDEARRHQLRYTKPECWPVLNRLTLPAAVHAGILAQMLDCTVADVRRLLDELDETVAAAAARLLADPAVRAALEQFPFHDGDRLVAVGDSLTADRIGWFEILRAALRLVGNGAELVNLGVSGNTTADALERVDLVEAAHPTHVLVMLGTNDSRRHGWRRDHRMVSPHETRRNLAALTDLITDELGTPVRMVTPPPADQHVIDRFFAGQPLRWNAVELAETAEVVRGLDPDCIDVHDALCAPTPSPVFEDDGVHLNLTGQRAVAATIAIGVSETASFPGGDHPRSELPGRR